MIDIGLTETRDGFIDKLPKAEFNKGGFPPCFPIVAPHDDPQATNSKCTLFVRLSQFVAVLSFIMLPVYAREQLNHLILHIDASNVCGSSERESEDLRDKTSQYGLLRESFHL